MDDLVCDYETEGFLLELGIGIYIAWDAANEGWAWYAMAEGGNCRAMYYDAPGFRRISNGVPIWRESLNTLPIRAGSGLGHTLVFVGMDKPEQDENRFGASIFANTRIVIGATTP